MSLRRRLLAPLLAVLLGWAMIGGGSVAFAATPHGKVSFSLAQEQFNCTICHEPLNEARSPEAFQENALLRKLIKRGDTMGQIRRAMVANYGISVLANPPKRGFAVLIVVVPVAVIVLGLIVLAYTIPRWRRRSARQASAAPLDVSPPSPADEQRLAAELSRHS